MHDWRAELIRAIASRQQPDGSWVNPNNRWLEGDANLVTGYALLALVIAGRSHEARCAKGSRGACQAASAT